MSRGGGGVVNIWAYGGNELSANQAWPTPNSISGRKDGVKRLNVILSDV